MWTKIKQFFTNKQEEIRDEIKEFTYDKDTINGIQLPVVIPVKVKHLQQAIKIAKESLPLELNHLPESNLTEFLRRLYLSNENCLLATTFKMYFNVPSNVKLGQGGHDFSLYAYFGILYIYETGPYYMENLQEDYEKYLKFKDNPEKVLRNITVSPK